MKDDEIWNRDAVHASVLGEKCFLFEDGEWRDMAVVVIKENG